MIRYHFDGMGYDYIAHHVGEGACPVCGCKPEDPGDTEHAADCPDGPVALALASEPVGRVIAELRRALAAEARRVGRG